MLRFSRLTNALGKALPATFDPNVRPPTAALLEAMNEFLDSLRVTEPLVEGGRVSAASHGATDVVPNVRFGRPRSPATTAWSEATAPWAGDGTGAELPGQ